jgi:hypothetical protein
MSDIYIFPRSARVLFKDIIQRVVRGVDSSSRDYLSLILTLLEFARQYLNGTLARDF